MARSAASKAEQAAAALDAYLREGLKPAARPIPAAQHAPVDDPAGRGLQTAPGHPQATSATGRTPDRPLPSGGPLHLAHTDWLHHRLCVSGPVADLDAFRHAAAGAGTIPWPLDLDSAAEDWFHLLATPAHRDLSLVACRKLAAQLREAVERRHALAVARVGHSRACPLDLHALVPVPPDILRLGPDHPHALAWLWQHWGTTAALRHVAPARAGKAAPAQAAEIGQAAWRLAFWSADWTPWTAFARMRAGWPGLRFDVQPDYALQ